MIACKGGRLRGRKDELAGGIPLRTAQYKVGSLVRARGREWVVLPSEDSDVLMLRPLSGSEDESCGIFVPLEGHELEDATFPDPVPTEAGDFIAGSLLRDAARLTLRSSAAPLRSFGRISVRPRPYQLVPLIMALRLDPVRMLIADDVGIGKTIEASLIARELLDRGEVHRICVLCPPHLCDQWQRELATKFQIQAAIVRTNTIARLERDLPRINGSIYRHYRHLVVSIDFVKGDRRRGQFLADCPDLVIVDEAHTAAQPGGIASRNQQQRHELVHSVAAEVARHLILLTATPHSGLEESFHSLLGLIRPEYESWSVGTLTEPQRRDLAKRFVQRLRADVRKWLGPETTFPERKPEDIPYSLSRQYEDLFQDILSFTRETVYHEGLSERRQRVRYWAALSLLRCVMSSPAAGAAALRSAADRARSASGDAEEVDDEVRQWEVMDPIREEGVNDTVPDTAVTAGERDLEESERRRLQAFARKAEALAKDDGDQKIEKAAEIVSRLLKQGHRPIVYCRFIETAKYVADQLQKRLQTQFKDLRTLAVTSETGGDEEREERIEELAESPRRVLVATDCLSEGVNLQDHFDAILHYDLPWNPNRLEQREGRVDRFGQQTQAVPAILLYGADNPIDMIVLQVLIRKAREIFKATGVRVPVPVESESVVQALTEAFFKRAPNKQVALPMGIEGIQQEAETKRLLSGWDRAAELEKESRTRFAQHAIRPDEVAKELELTDLAVGDPEAVRSFFMNAAQRLGISVQTRDGYCVVAPESLGEDLRAHLGWKKPKRVAFDSPLPKAAEDADILDRNHPLITRLSDRILSEAFAHSPRPDRPFARCGAAFSRDVARRTALLLLRLRYRMMMRRESDLFAEEVLVAGFRALGDEVEWLATGSEELLSLLKSVPSGPISSQERVEQVQWALDTLRASTDPLEQLKRDRAAEVEASYNRLRQDLQTKRVSVSAYDPDVLGVYVLIPGGRR